MVAVVCLLNRPNTPEGVFIFSSPVSLSKWMIQVIHSLGPHHRTADHKNGNADDELIEQFQSSLEIGELFHQFDVFDLREQELG